MKETWWQTCRVGRGSRLIAIWRRLEAVALATAMISSFAFVPLCAYANETGSTVVSGGGVIAYTNAAATGTAVSDSTEWRRDHLFVGETDDIAHDFCPLETARRNGTCVERMAANF